MTDKKTTLVDIYEAAGAKVSDDRTMVTVSNKEPLKPFEIVLTVYPQAITQDGDGERVTFAVLLDDEYVIDKRLGRADIRWVSYSDTEIELPVSQIRIHKAG